MFKNLVAAIACISILVGCAHYEKIFNPKGETVCDRPGYMENSLLCRVTAKYKTTPEAHHNLLLNAAAIGVITDAWEKKLVCIYLSVLREYYSRGMSWKLLVNFMKTTEDQSRLLAGIVDRSIPLSEFNVDMVISKEDAAMLEKAWKDHWDQLGCK